MLGADRPMQPGFHIRSSTEQVLRTGDLERKRERRAGEEDAELVATSWKGPAWVRELEKV